MGHHAIHSHNWCTSESSKLLNLSIWADYFYEITDILTFAKHDSFLKDVIPSMSISFPLIIEFQ